MKRFILLALLLIGMVVSSILQATPASACSCVPGDRSDAADAAHYDVIFIGEAVRVRDLGEADDPNSTVRWTFDVRRVNKGRAGERQDVETNKGGGLCGYPFRVGHRYQVWAEERRGTLTAHLCSPTRDLADADPFDPTSEQDGRATVAGETHLATTGVAGVAAATGSLLLLSGVALRHARRYRAGH